MARGVLALDVGEARIGLAAGELGRPWAFGRGYLVRRDEASDIRAVREAAAREGAELVVVGLPRRTDGGDSPQTERVRSFAAALERSGLTVALEDERFTTRIAGERLRASGLGRRRRREKGLLDEGAAVLILESFLSRQADR